MSTAVDVEEESKISYFPYMKCAFGYRRLI